MTDRERMRNYWNEMAGDRANWHIAHIDDEDEFFASGPRTVEKIFDGRIHEVPSGSTILDIGCGNGRVARAVAEARPDIRVYGVDVAPTMISKAMKANHHILNLSFQVGNGVSLAGFPDEAFDYVYSFIVFQHLPRHITGQYIDEAARVLKPGGRLIFQVQQRTTVDPVDPPWNNFRQIRYYTESQATALVHPPLKLEGTRGGGHDFFVEAIKL